MSKRTSPFIFKYWALQQEHFSLGLFIGAAGSFSLQKRQVKALERCSDSPEQAQGPQQGFRTFGCIRDLPSSSSSQ